ncbi:HNH endonuclease [Candidatus Poseidonia alphae]|nr:HNH endonuclease [Candidatus Poseidonia alphae]
MDLAVRYKEQLSSARQFLSVSGKAKNGTSINDGRELTLLKNRAQCPHCGIQFEGGNHNTEHIHPRALGGENTDHNRIQFCLACNNARNLVMQAILGHPPYFKNYPGNWAMVEEYLLWSELSIDDGLSAGSQVDLIHQKFLMYRFSGRQLPAQLINAYGRFSSWKKGDLPNYKQGTRQRVERKQNIPQKVKRKGMFISVLDRLFGYNVDQEPPKVKAIATAQPAAVQNQTEQKTTLRDKEVVAAEQSDNVLKSKLTQRPMTEFRSVILSFLTATPITISHLGDHVKDYMNTQGMSGSTTTDFLNLYGLPKGLKKALETHLAEEVMISGVSPKHEVARTISSSIRANESIHRSIEEFRTIILSFLTTEPIQIAEIGKKIVAYMEGQGISERTTTDFLKLFGLPRGMKKAIQEHLSEKVIITGSSPKFEVAKISEGTEGPANTQPSPEELLESWRSAVIEGHERGTPIDFGVFWGLISGEQKRSGQTWTHFLTPFGVNSKGPIPKKVRQLLDLTQLNYSIEGEVPNQTVILDSTPMGEEE